VPTPVLYAKRTRDMRRGTPTPRPQRTVDDAYSRVAQYQAEWRGMVQYYRRAYNLHILQPLKPVLEVSRGQTFAQKDKMTCQKIYRRYGATIQTEAGDRKVLRATIDRAPPKQPFTTHVGAVSLRWNTWVSLNDAPTTPIWSGRSEVVERLLAHTCALCGSHEPIAVPHSRKRADLASTGQDKPPSWKRRMVARQRQS
jgi:Type II intron maturase